MRCEASPMSARVAQPAREHERALQIQAGVVLVGEADRAVQLDHLAGDAQPGVARARLAAAGNLHSLVVADAIVELAHGLVEHGAHQLLLDVEVSGLVLQGLEAADGLAELHASPHVRERHRERRLGDTEHLGRREHGGLVEGALERGKGRISRRGNDVGRSRAHPDQLDDAGGVSSARHS
jgi:hypothetical protein